MTLTGPVREEIARILETVARDGLPGPRDLDVALDAIGCALPDNEPGWINVVASRLPDKGATVLVCWPLLKYAVDAAGEQRDVLGDVPHRYAVCTTVFEWSGHFADPPGADAIGDYFGDDHEYAEQPTHWMPVPPIPAGLPPEVGYAP